MIDDVKLGELVSIQARGINIITMVCERNQRLRYTTALRAVLIRYRETLLKEKRSLGVEAVDPPCSSFCRKYEFPASPLLLVIELSGVGICIGFGLQIILVLWDSLERGFPLCV